MSYKDKLNNHKKLKFEDIKELVLEQANKLGVQDYISNVITIKDNSAFAAYNRISGELLVSNKYVRRVKKHTNSYGNVIDKIIDNSNDLYNIYTIYVVFHELWHVRQRKMITENLMDNYLEMVSIAYNMAHKSASRYNFHHNSYFYEFDADINAISCTLDYIKQFNFNKYSVIIANRIFARTLLASYNCNLEKYFYKKYNCKNTPVSFNSFLNGYFSIDIEDDEYYRNCEVIANYIKNETTDNDFENMIKGVRMTTNIRQFLALVSAGVLDTTDVLSATKEQNKRYIKC